MSRMQPHSFVGGSNYNSLGNLAGPKVQNGPSNALSGYGTFVAGMGAFTAACFVYGIVKKKPSELNMGYITAAAGSTLPVATDMWINGGRKYGDLTSKGLAMTYVSLAAPPLVAIFMGSVLGNSIAAQSPKPKTRKKAWYQGRFAGSRSASSDKKGYRRDKDDEQQDKQNRRRKQGRGRKDRKRRKTTRGN
jgi:hypothetical protein